MCWRFFWSSTNGFPGDYPDCIGDYFRNFRDAESAAVIVIVITMNAILGTVQTVKAEQSLQSLKKLSGPEAKVLRNGTVTPIPARELVVGDVILLEARGIMFRQTDD